MRLVRIARFVAIGLWGVIAGASVVWQAAAAGAQERRSALPLLEELERADEGLEALMADIQYIRRFLLQGDQHVRQGRLYYAQEFDVGENGQLERRRRFGVHFDVLYMDDRKEDDQQVFIFDGEWLIEKRPQEKQFIARQMAPPGAEMDPLRLGEGPIPFPIGQRADDVLERFSAEELDAGAGLEDETGLAEFVAGCRQLHLTPHDPGAHDEDFQEIRIWYNPDTRLPRAALTINRAGDESIVQLLNVRRLGVKDLPAGALSTEPPALGEGWDVQVEEFRGGEDE